MILLFSVGRIVQLENISFPHPCHLVAWITCCLSLSWAACVSCILNRSWDLLFWEPPSFSTPGKQLMQQWLKIDRHEHFMFCEASLSGAGLCTRGKTTLELRVVLVLLWTLADVQELFHELAEHPCGHSAPEGSTGASQNTQWWPGLWKWAATGKSSYLL